MEGGDEWRAKGDCKRGEGGAIVRAAVVVLF